MFALLVILMLAIALIRWCVMQTKRNMSENNRTFLEELQHEANNINAAKRRRNKGWRYQSATNGIITVTLPDADPLVIPEGTYEQKVFTYDGRPLKGTRKGSRFVLDVVPGCQSMVSVYTGTEWASNASVAYNSQLIGYIGDGAAKSKIELLMGRYPYVRVHARRDGTDAGGWPYVTLLLPPPSWLDNALKGGDA